jgi:hypothetical protein
MPILKFLSWRLFKGSVGEAKTTANRRPLRSPNRQQDRRSYQAVEIRAHMNSCAQAKALAGKRFLVAEAPALPLDQCNASCRCTYKNHADRRHDPRRSSDVGVSSRFYIGAERRSGMDRRLGDRRRDDYFGYMREHSPDDQ